MASDMEILKAFGAEIGAELKPASLSALQLQGVLVYALDEAKRVIDLRLNNRAVGTLPAALFQLQSLQTLNLNSNRLTSLPPGLSQLQSLQALDLSFNQRTYSVKPLLRCFRPGVGPVSGDRTVRRVQPHQLRPLLGRRGERWYVFGAQAVILWGAPRMSADVDVTVELAPEGIHRGYSGPRSVLSVRRDT